MTFEVREARPEEYGEAGRVTAEAYREFVQPGQSEWLAYLARITDIGERASRTTILIALEDDHILGSLTLELESRVSGSDDDPPLRPDEAHVRMLGVDPAARARGVGVSLMREAEERARAAGKTYLTLDTTQKMDAAQKMYASLGYERTDHAFVDGFLGALLGYRKELDATASS
jgi:ribosomal protein S18 acetylase RimI-like enzyme